MDSEWMLWCLGHGINRALKNQITIVYCISRKANHICIVFTIVIYNDSWLYKIIYNDCANLQWLIYQHETQLNHWLQPSKSHRRTMLVFSPSCTSMPVSMKNLERECDVEGGAHVAPAEWSPGYLRNHHTTGNPEGKPLPGKPPPIVAGSWTLVAASWSTCSEGNLTKMI